MSKVLIVDDEESVRTYLQMTLEGEGYEVEVAINGREALALYEQQPADVVITDIAMPEMTGFDLIVELTRRWAHIKVIAISGLAENLAIAKMLGACEALQKPFNADDFSRTTRHVVGRPPQVPTGG
jgi:DNA-binding NtrC family response regulator